METYIAFILGISLVVVLAIAIVAVMAFVRVLQLKNDIRSIESWICSLEKEYHDDVDRLYSCIDSRFDKFENKLVVKKQLIKD